MVAVRVFLSTVIYHHTLLSNFCSKKVKISPTINAVCIPIYREINQGDRAAQQADRSWFLRGQQGKIKER
jgi:hypothetical protein